MQRRSASFASCAQFLHTSHPLAWSVDRPNINFGLSLPASPARLRVSHVRTGRWPVAHSDLRPHRGVAPAIPICPSREHFAPRPLRRIALWSVLPGAKRTRRFIRLSRPVAPFSWSGRANLPSIHTCERGSISSGWPPNPSSSRNAELFGEGDTGGEGGSVREGVRVLGAVLGKLLRPASWRLRRPDPGRFGNQTFGHATTLPWWASSRTSGETKMAYDQANTYETIKLFGLTEKGAQLRNPRITS